MPWTSWPWWWTGRMELAITYDRKRWTEPAMHRFLDALEDALRRVVAHCLSTDDDGESIREFTLGQPVRAGHRRYSRTGLTDLGRLAPLAHSQWEMDRRFHARAESAHQPAVSALCGRGCEPVSRLGRRLARVDGRSGRSAARPGNAHRRGADDQRARPRRSSDGRASALGQIDAPGAVRPQHGGDVGLRTPPATCARAGWRNRLCSCSPVVARPVHPARLGRCTICPTRNSAGRSPAWAARRRRCWRATN